MNHRTITTVLLSISLFFTLATAEESGLYPVVLAENSPMQEVTELQPPTQEDERYVPPVKRSTRWYVGADYAVGKTDIDTDYDYTDNFVPASESSSHSKTEDTDAIKLKVGYKFEENWRIQGYWKSEDVENIDENIYGVGVDVIKGFELTPKLEPFILVGAGYDTLDFKSGEDSDDTYAYSYSAGVGLMYKLTKEIELVGGVDWQYRDWDNVKLDAVDLDVDDTSTKFYMGVNYHF